MSAESVPTDRLIGQVLAERYEILHRLGEGAMGVVYKARHVKVGRPFAVKVLHARLLTDGKVAQRFEREAELAGRLRHPNVVGVVDVGELDDMHYMVMDFAEGPDLAQLLVEAPMPPARIVSLVRQMLDGLYHAHEQGLIHRDFKPENVIIERDSHGSEMPRIVDFGIALLREGSDAIDGNGRLTTNGLVLGTPHYMAPEQAVADPIDHRIDLFALGIVIYEMLSGRLPFDGSGAEVARANLLLDPPAISQRVPYLEVDPLLEAFARRLMAKKRDARPSDARVARELLDLVERDRRAAGLALGVSPELSERAPAMTQPVVRHDRGPVTGERTVPMRPTPQTPADQVLAKWLAATPSQPIEPARIATEGVPSSSVPASPSGPTWAPPAQHGPIHTLPGPPMVFSAAKPDADAYRETTMRTPLGWPATQRSHRRTGWILGGIAIGAAAFVSVWLATHGATHATRSEPHVELSSLAPAPGSGSAATPPPIATQPSPVSPAPAVAPPVVEPAPTPPVSAVVQPATPVHPATHVTVRDPKPRVPVPASHDHSLVTHPEVVVETKPVAAHPAEKPPEPAATDTKPVLPPAPPDPTPAKPVEHKPSKPAASHACDAAPPSMSGITANALSVLYYKVAKDIGQLSPDQTQDLWGRFTLHNVNDLMAQPSDGREQAATSLWLIDRDALCRRAR